MSRLARFDAIVVVELVVDRMTPGLISLILGYGTMHSGGGEWRCFGEAK